MPYQAHELRGSYQGTDYLFLWVGENLGSRDQTDTVLATYQRTADRIHKAGGRYVLVLVPSKYRVMYPLCTWPDGSTLRDTDQHLSPLRDGLAKWANDKGLPCLDLTLPMQKAAQAGNVPYFAQDTHPNGAGHQLMTEQLATFLKSL